MLWTCRRRGESYEDTYLDDSAFMRTMIINILKDGNHEISQASNGTEAVQRYVEGKPDLVFMDIVMPDKDGVQALKEIKAQDVNAKVVMCTSVGGQEKIVNDAIQAGASDIITKPFRPEEITKVINNIQNF